MDYRELLTLAPVGKGGLYRVRCPSQRFGAQGWSSGEEMPTLQVTYVLNANKGSWKRMTVALHGGYHVQSGI